MTVPLDSLEVAVRSQGGAVIQVSLRLHGQAGKESNMRFVTIDKAMAIYGLGISAWKDQW